MARLAIYELGENPNNKNGSGQSLKCGNVECRVYMMPSKAEMLLPLYPQCRISDRVSHEIDYQVINLLPKGPRTIFHPRMYSESKGQIICDEFSDKLINANGAKSEDPWLTVAGLTRNEQTARKTKCLKCGSVSHTLRNCR